MVSNWGETRKGRAFWALWAMAQTYQTSPGHVSPRLFFVCWVTINYVTSQVCFRSGSVLSSTEKAEHWDFSAPNQKVIICTPYSGTSGSKIGEKNSYAKTPQRQQSPRIQWNLRAVSIALRRQPFLFSLCLLKRCSVESCYSLLRIISYSMYCVLHTFANLITYGPEKKRHLNRWA